MKKEPQYTRCIRGLNEEYRYAGEKCSICGALVSDTDAHTEFHEELREVLQDLINKVVWNHV